MSLEVVSSVLVDDLCRNDIALMQITKMECVTREVIPLTFRSEGVGI